jgi:peptidoglycan-associated lipoprotein
MKRITSPVSVSFIFLLSVFVLWGCPKKAEVASAPEAPQQVEPAAPVQAEPVVEPAPEPVKEEPKPEPAPIEEEKERAAAAEAEGLQPVYFDFDRSFVRDDARAVMKTNAEWLKANPTAKVRIEGNCDERGTIEYNQALGQRRAASAKKYLTDLGISAGRISLISYGKEKPVCTEGNEECWQKNRRGDLVVAE